MNAKEQDKIWNDLSEESKNKLREMAGLNLREGHYLFKDFEKLFGSHNLNPEPPTPKTWEDVVAQEECNFDMWLNKIQNAWFGYPICDKMIATAKIAKLIELSYGGIVSEEEWEDYSEPKYVITCSYKGEIGFEYSLYDRFFIAFHSSEQRQEFWSHESNRKLVEQYFLL